ncbi:MAG: L-seryl-tRNA(Sec) selenium transferase [Pyrinomonadaceae bacterium]
MPADSKNKTELRNLPSVDSILQTDTAKLVENKFGRDKTLNIVRTAIDRIRDVAASNGMQSKEAAIAEIERYLQRALSSESKHRIQRVINATGIVIHTNLGRSPLSEAAVASISAASSYCNLEYDLETGARGRRGRQAEKLLAEITGAEEALIVNNCAAAALLVLSTLAKAGEVIVSRGELVEIGGDFRIPDVLEQSGAKLKEIGTTNRTKLTDYERAISSETKLILRVHPSNYRITGFTETPELSDLAALAHKHDLPLFEDAGSGMLVDLAEFGLGDEPLIRSSIDDGADIVSFSGDKLMGGVQAGMIVGRKVLIQRLRKNPMYRALRVDKLAYAAIEATLSLFAQGTAFDEIPVMRMLSISDEDLKKRAVSFVEKASAAKSMKIEIIDGNSAIGGGAAPGVMLPTALIAIEHAKLSANEFASVLRSLEPPVITRLADDKLLIDLRTVAESDEEILLKSINDAA